MTTLISIPTLITAIVGALAGAIMGGLVSHFTTKRRERRGRQIKLVAEFSALYSNYEAALIRFQRARIKDNSHVMSEGSHSVLCNLIETDGVAQRLWWEFVEAFPQEIVARNLWEYLRRVSLVKQLLLFSEHPDVEFAVGMTWICAQAHKTIETCSSALSVNSTPDGRPLFLGMAPIDEEELKRYESAEDPMTEIQTAKMNAKIEEMRTSSGAKNLNKGRRADTRP